MHALTPDGAGVSLRPLGPEHPSQAAAGVSRRAAGRVKVFSPTFDASEEVRAGTLGARLTEFNCDVAIVVNRLTEQLEALATRVVGVEAAQRTLADDAGQALREIVGQARAEFGATNVSLAILRGEATHHVMDAMVALEEARKAMGLFDHNMNATC